MATYIKPEAIKDASLPIGKVAAMSEDERLAFLVSLGLGNLTEVPDDGKVYGRTHGEWVEVGDGDWKYWGNITPTKDTIKYKFMPLSEAKEVYIVIRRTTKTGSGITWFGVIDNFLTLAGVCYSNNYTQDWAAHIIADIETKSIRSDFNYNMNPQALLIDNRIIAENKWGISFGSADSIAGDEVIHIWYK